MAHEHAAQRQFHFDADGTIDWDELYSQQEQTWSGQPNGALLAQVSELPAARVLDVGCGEGADVIWLAQQGWAVTALEVSQVALARAQAHAAAAQITATWVHGKLESAELPLGSFELVSVQYPGLRRTPDARAERTLLELVAPGGLLLAVFHADVDPEQARAHGFEPEDYVGYEQIRAMLGGDWDVLLDGRSPRLVSSGRGAQHVEDLIVLARKRA
jgi:SAM-dependent methyltransferase